MNVQAGDKVKLSKDWVGYTRIDPTCFYLVLYTNGNSLIAVFGHGVFHSKLGGGARPLVEAYKYRHPGATFAWVHDYHTVVTQVKSYRSVAPKLV